MHGVYHVKIVYAQQARLVNNYKNTKLKMLKNLHVCTVHQ